MSRAKEQFNIWTEGENKKCINPNCANRIWRYQTAMQGIVYEYVRYCDDFCKHEKGARILKVNEVKLKVNEVNKQTLCTQ